MRGMEKLVLTLWLFLALCWGAYFFQTAPNTKRPVIGAAGPSQSAGNAEPDSRSGEMVQSKIWTGKQLDAFVSDHHSEIEFVSSDYLRWRNWTATKFGNDQWLCKEYR